MSFSIGFKGTLAGLRSFLATENPLKMMKNAFYFTSKALFLLKIFKFLFGLFVHVPNWLYYKTIVIHILPNNLRSKGNQIMKFGQ